MFRKSGCKATRLHIKEAIREVKQRILMLLDFVMSSPNFEEQEESNFIEVLSSVCDTREK